MKLFVAGLPYDVDDEELLEIFEKFGPVVSAKVTLDKETGKSRGFGFVQMQLAEDGEQAIELLNEISLSKNGKPLVVKKAEDRPSNSGGGGGGFKPRGEFQNGNNNNNNRNYGPPKRPNTRF
jgi:RNA recognition motif-containing protein